VVIGFQVKTKHTKILIHATLFLVDLGWKLKFSFRMCSFPAFQWGFFIHTLFCSLC